ncbi:hypothetical protein T492DRAFT_64602 [Pavlovales sp. CCMP2436]|nr:hypothetical protein T492DRAFT_64602 [Pavlovales sp. CCMP2436]
MSLAEEPSSSKRAPRPIERFVSRGSVIGGTQALDALRHIGAKRAADAHYVSATGVPPPRPPAPSAQPRPTAPPPRPTVAAASALPRPASKRPSETAGGCTAPPLSRCTRGQDCLSRVHCERAIGWQLDVYWSPDRRWYSAEVIAYDAKRGAHELLYYVGSHGGAETEVCCLGCSRLHVVSKKPVPLCWRFDCVCGVRFDDKFGYELDSDGSSVHCFQCQTWMHAHCVSTGGRLDHLEAYSEERAKVDEQLRSHAQDLRELKGKGRGKEGGPVDEAQPLSLAWKCAEVRFRCPTCLQVGPIYPPPPEGGHSDDDSEEDSKVENVCTSPLPPVPLPPPSPLPLPTEVDSGGSSGDDGGSGNCGGGGGGCDGAGGSGDVQMPEGGGSGGGGGGGVQMLVVGGKARATRQLERRAADPLGEGSGKTHATRQVDRRAAEPSSGEGGNTRVTRQLEQVPAPDAKLSSAAKRVQGRTPDLAANGDCHLVLARAADAPPAATARAAPCRVSASDGAESDLDDDAIRAKNFGHPLSAGEVWPKSYAARCVARRCVLSAGRWGRQGGESAVACVGCSARLHVRCIAAETRAKLSEGSKQGKGPLPGLR